MDLDRPIAASRDVDVEVGRAWRDHRRHLLDVAFRTLGSLSDAEDAVQETFVRLVRSDVAQIEDVGGWLVVVVSRICLDRLRSEQRHPTVPGELVDDRPSDAAVDPADRVTLDDSVRLALHVVLARLSPAERTAFVLHDVFQYSFEAIAEVVGRTPAACRQLASRARRTIAADGGRARFHVETAEQRRIADRFIAACSTGDIDGLIAVLDPDVDGIADVGGRVGRVVVTGRDAVAAAALRYLGPDTAATLLALPAGGEIGVVAVRGDRVVSLLLLETRDDRIAHFDGLVDPGKLEPVARALGLR